MTIFDAHGVLTFRARHRIRESLKGGGGILYYLYLSSNLKNLKIVGKSMDAGFRLFDDEEAQKEGSGTG